MKAEVIRGAGSHAAREGAIVECTVEGRIHEVSVAEYSIVEALSVDHLTDGTIVVFGAGEGRSSWCWGASR